MAVSPVDAHLAIEDVRLSNVDLDSAWLGECSISR